MNEPATTRRFRARLSQLRWLIRLRLLGEALAWAVLAAVGAVAAMGGLDYLLRLDRPLRAGLLVAGVGGVLAAVWRWAVRPLGVPAGDGDLAMLLERRFPTLQERLISALELAGPAARQAGMSGAMIRHVTEQADRALGNLSVRSVVSFRRTRRLWAAAVAVVLGGVGLAMLQPATAKLIVDRSLLLREVHWPQETYLNLYALTPDGRRRPLLETGPDGQVRLGGQGVNVLRGGRLSLVAEPVAGSVAPATVTLHANWPSLGQTIQSVSRNEQGLYVIELQSVREALTFYITGGDDRRDARAPHRVRLIDPPALTALQAIIEPPAYLRAGSMRRLDARSGVVPVPLGATVTLIGQASKPLVTARLRLNGSPSEPIDVRPGPDGRPTSVRGRFQVGGENRPASQTLTLLLTDERGFTNTPGEQVLLQVRPDRPPTITLRSRGVRQVIAPTAMIPLEVNSRDDHGVAEARVRWWSESMTATQPASAPAPQSVGEPIVSPAGQPSDRLDATRVLDLQPFALPVDTQVFIQADAIDRLPAPVGPNRTSSGVLTFRVVAGEELLAQLIARQKEIRMSVFAAQALQQRAIGSADQARSQLADGQSALARRSAGQSRTLQRDVRQALAQAARGMRDVLDEMRLNRLGSPQEYLALEDEVAAPLETLTERMQQTLTTMDGVVDGPDRTTLDDVLARQHDHAAAMEAILSAMRKMENRIDLARRLEGLLKMAVELNTLLRRRAEQKTEELFDPTE